MAESKDKSGRHSSFGGASGLNGKTITAVDVHQSGATMVIEISYSGGSTFVKVRGFELEYGGTNDWGSGTRAGL